MHRTAAVALICLLATLPALRAQRFVDAGGALPVRGAAVDPARMAGGVVWFDYNNDRYPDLLLTNGSQPTRLLRNDWNGNFTDVSEGAGLLSVVGTMGAVSGDFDGDGYADLFITTMAGTPSRLLRNDRAGGFEDVSRAAGITEISYGASATTGDYDGDGDQDIYVTNYLAGREAREGGQPNFLYRNDGNFTFTEVAASLGLDDAGCGLGATFSDLNKDGRPDLYVANDYGYLVEPNASFRNDYPVFTPTSARNGTDAAINAMGVAKGDYDNDGDIDLYVTNIRVNPLFENREGGEFFAFRSLAAGVALPELTGWGTSFTDFDLDGHLDLIVANGQVAGTDNAAEEQRYYRNDGEGAFTDASAASGIAAVVLHGRGLAVADYNLDGYPDVAINAVAPDPAAAARATLLRNAGNGGGGRWLAVELPPNALGVELHAGARTRYREVDGGSSYLSHSAGPLHFGAPAGTAAVDSLVVSFTDQPPRTVTGPAWDRLVGVRADGSWFRIAHETRSRCGAVALPPLVEHQWDEDSAGHEVLLVSRTETLAYPRLEERVIELSAGEVFRDTARTQDAVLVDTVAGDGPCPSLQPLRLRVLPATVAPTVYPNPLTSRRLHLQLPPGGGRLEVELLTVTGKVLLRRSRSIAPHLRTVALPLPSLPRGSLLLRLRFNGSTTYHKLIHP